MTPHQCVPPMRDDSRRIVSGYLFVPIPTGRFGDVWRCLVCRTLWRVGNDCDACDPGPPGGHCRRGGYHPSALKWRRAGWWLRLRHCRRSGAGKRRRIPRTEFSVHTAHILTFKGREMGEFVVQSWSLTQDGADVQLLSRDAFNRDQTGCLFVGDVKAVDGQDSS